MNSKQERVHCSHCFFDMKIADRLLCTIEIGFFVSKLKVYKMNLYYYILLLVPDMLGRRGVVSK